MKTPKISWLYIKIGLYGFLLYSVVSIMQYVKSSSFSGNIDVLMGSPSQMRSLQWCSNSVQVVFLTKTSTTVREPKQIQQLCRMDYSSYKAEEVKGLEWSPLMRSLNDKGEETILQTDPTLGFIKIGSLIYKVDTLKQRLITMGLPQN